MVGLGNLPQQGGSAMTRAQWLGFACAMVLCGVAVVVATVIKPGDQVAASFLGGCMIGFGIMEIARYRRAP